MEKYFEILELINKENLLINKLYILDSCHMATKELNWAVTEYTYRLWLDADTDLDLAKLTDIVCDNWEEIQSEEIQRDEIITICLS